MKHVITLLLALGLSAPALHAQPGGQASLAKLIDLLEQQQEELRQLRGQMEELNHQVHQMRKDGEMAFLNNSAIKAPVNPVKNLVDESPAHTTVDPLEDLADEQPVAKKPDHSNKTEAKAEKKAPAKNTTDDKTASKAPANSTKDLSDTKHAGKTAASPTQNLADTTSASKAPANSTKDTNDTKHVGKTAASPAQNLADKTSASKSPTNSTKDLSDAKHASKTTASPTQNLADTTSSNKAPADPTTNLADKSSGNQSSSSTVWKDSEARPEANSTTVYNEARTLIDQGRLAEAEVALTQFIKKYPKDPMLVNAQYWLAETYYARSDFAQAALKFGDAYQAYQDHKNSSFKEAAMSKGQEIIFKLASSLYNIGKYDESRIVLKELENKKEFPKLQDNIKRQADTLRREIARKAKPV